MKKLINNRLKKMEQSETIGGNRVNHLREKKLNNIPALVYCNGQKVSLKLINEREGGIGATISNLAKGKIGLEVGSHVEIETVIIDKKGEDKMIKMKLVVKHISPANNLGKKYIIGFEYSDDNDDNFSLRSNKWTAGTN